MPRNNRPVIFSFSPTVPFAQARETFELALLAAESLHGPERLTLEACYQLDDQTRTIEISGDTDIGGTIALIFLGYARREFGADAVRMKRCHVMASGEAA